MKVHIQRELLLMSLLFVLGSSMNLGLETNDVTDNYISAKINWLFDKFLTAYKEELIIKGKTEMPVQNFEEHFSSKVFIFNIEGYMSVVNGSIKNLTSLQRTGDVTLDKDGYNITLTAHIGMTDFIVRYQQYELSLMGLTQSGSIGAVVGSNSVGLKILVITQPKCKVYLQSLDLEKLENIDIDITGLGPMNTLTDDISSWVITHIAHSYKTNLQNIIFADIDKAIQDVDLCHHFPIVS